jgi:predicted alpha/beta-hydrolase family hydrolase
MNAGTESFVVEVAGSQTTALSYRSSGGAPASAVIVLAHGAGAPQTHPWMIRMAGALASRGLDVITFNFLYAEARRRLPDKAPVLEATWRAVVAATRSRSEAARRKLFIGGKSMGGRMATHVAAMPGAIDGLAGLVLLGYPLHPPGRPDKLRAAHLARVEVPMLFVQGSRDAFGAPGELEPFVTPLAPRRTRIFAIEGGDHSLVPPKSSGLDLGQVMARVADEIARFTA